MYKHYAEAARLIPGFGARADQQWAAVGMKLGAGTFIWGIVGYLFVQWWKDSQAGLADDNMRPIVNSRVTPALTVDDDVLTWEQVQAEFDRLDRTATLVEPTDTPSGTPPTDR